MANEPLPLRCATCRFWKAVEDQEGEDLRGECRRLPPTFNAPAARRWFVSWSGEHADAMGREDYSEGFWPLTWDDDWCGEHQPTPP
jgi:hypothetical protein